MVSTITAVGVFEAVSLILAFTLAFSRVYPLLPTQRYLRFVDARCRDRPAFVNEAACCNEAAPARVSTACSTRGLASSAATSDLVYTLG